MVKVSIIGSGNVAQHLIQAFEKSTETELIQVFSRKKDTVSHLIAKEKITNNYNELKEADVYIISVSDNAISKVSSELPFQEKLVVHTSGSIDMTALDSKNRKGVFYPVQTFSKNKPVNFKSIPLCLEIENQDDYTILEKIAKSISDRIYTIDSPQRKSLHVSAVFVCNFVNHLYHIGNEICENSNIPFDILKPLIKETAEKVMLLSPNEAQTGPAIRNDHKTIEAHLAFLTNETQKNIYKIITQSIQENVKKL
jgi:predicted short-subunit dehydrogenase-like oxidoreductase (DUF2520 family)